MDRRTDTLDRCQQLFAGHRRILSRVVDLAPNMGHAGDVRDRQLAEHRRVRTAPVSLDRVGLGSGQGLGGSVLRAVGSEVENHLGPRQPISKRAVNLSITHISFR